MEERVRKIWLTSAYFLFPLLLLEIVTGFGLIPETRGYVFGATGGLLTRGVSQDLHILLTAPLIVVFLTHAMLSFKFRLPVAWQGRLQWPLLALGVLAGAVLLYLYLMIFLGSA
ncbi:MAG: hypothetical protein HY558_01925 [Euryarchaeota archaeon]|nr:hypothetical protein [Euryarchaeota archaeon]